MTFLRNAVNTVFWIVFAVVMYFTVFHYDWIIAGPPDPNQKPVAMEYR